jgi:hypothetical protein
MRGDTATRGLVKYDDGLPEFLMHRAGDGENPSPRVLEKRALALVGVDYRRNGSRNSDIDAGGSGTATHSHANETSAVVGPRKAGSRDSLG